MMLKSSRILVVTWHVELDMKNHQNHKVGFVETHPVLEVVTKLSPRITRTELRLELYLYLKMDLTRWSESRPDSTNS